MQTKTISHNIDDIIVNFVERKSRIFPVSLLDSNTEFVPSSDWTTLRKEYSSLTSQFIADICQIQGIPTLGVSVFVLGSLARHELAPYSDVDIFIVLHEDYVQYEEMNSPHTAQSWAHKPAMSPAEMMDSVLYPLLNAGLKVDYSIRTLAEELDLFESDCTVALASLDHRLLYGDPELAAHFSELMLNQWRSTISTRINALQGHVRLRHERSGVISQLLEPDIKNSAGGIRDALCHKACNVAQISQINAGLPQSGENNFPWAYTFLLDVRTILQLLSHKSRDILYAQYGNDIAQLVGLRDRYELLRVLSRASRIITYCLHTSFMQARSLFSNSQNQSKISRYPLADGVVTDGCAIYLAKDAPQKDAALALRLAAAATRIDLPFDQSVLSYFHHIEAPIKFTPLMVQDLLTLLGFGKRSVRNIETLDQHGLWSKIFPEWQAVRDLPSRSAMHKYTVDKHLLETLHMIEPKLTSVKRPDLLLLACLFHDIGKGKERELIEARNQAEITDLAGKIFSQEDDFFQKDGAEQRKHEKNIEIVEHHNPHSCWFFPISVSPDPTVLSDTLSQIIDHSQIGEEIIHNIATRLGFSAVDRFRLELAIRLHLLLPQAAIHQDISDPHVIAHLAQEIHYDPIVLEILGALSEADALATGPGVLTEWKSHLLRVLVENISIYVSTYANSSEQNLTTHSQSLGLLDSILAPADLQQIISPDDNVPFEKTRPGLISSDQFDEIIIEPLSDCPQHATAQKSPLSRNHSRGLIKNSTCICESEHGAKRLVLNIQVHDLPVILAELTFNGLIIHGAIVGNIAVPTAEYENKLRKMSAEELRSVVIIVEPLFGGFPDKTILRQRLINAQKNPQTVLQLFMKRYGQAGSLSRTADTASPAKIRWLTDSGTPDTALLELRCRDHRGLLARICMIFAEYDAEINWGKMSTSAGIAQGSFSLKFYNPMEGSDLGSLCRNMGYQILDTVPQLA